MKYFFLLSFFLLTSCGNLELARYNSPKKMRGPASVGPFRLAWPLKNPKISRGFSPYHKNHYGIDMVKPLGTPIRAAHAGKVVYVGRKHYRGYGKLIILEHPSGWGSMYAHCHQTWVKEGQWIQLGQEIASVGKTGNARGVHLHFELRKNKKAVNPKKYLP